ncbi:hypothetical protein BD408DRAFT_416665, partial [Parasitella parasitica]
MSNLIQIEPATTTIHHIKAESKRSSNLYTCISRLRKMRTEIRRHRTLPANLPYQEKFLLQEDEEQDVDDFNEKINIVDTKSPPLSWSIRHTTQLAFPPRFNLIVNHDDLLPSIQDQEFDSSSSSTCSCSSYSKFNQQDSDDGEQEEAQHNYVYEDSDAYSATLQKLSGISF